VIPPETVSSQVVAVQTWSTPVTPESAIVKDSPSVPSAATIFAFSGTVHSSTPAPVAAIPMVTRPPLASLRVALIDVLAVYA